VGDKADPNSWVMVLPKPFFYGQFFGTGTEAILDKIYEDDPKAGKRWLGQVIEQLTVNNLLPPLGSVGYGIATNKDPFFETQLVPQSRLNAEPAEQARATTTSVSRGVAKGLDTAAEAVGYEGKRVPGAAHLDFATQALGGSLASTGLRLTERLFGDKPVATRSTPLGEIADVVGLGRFALRENSAGGYTIQTFYDNLKKVEEAKATLSAMKAEGRDDVADAYEVKHQTKIDLAQEYDSINREMGKLRKEQMDARGDKNLSAYERKAKIDALNLQIRELAASAPPLK
jgi:hypothetical protein